MSLSNDGPTIPSNVTCKDTVPINFIIIIIITIIIIIIIIIIILDNSKWTTETHKHLYIKPFIVGK